MAYYVGNRQMSVNQFNKDLLGKPDNLANNDSKNGNSGKGKNDGTGGKGGNKDTQPVQTVQPTQTIQPTQNAQPTAQNPVTVAPAQSSISGVSTELYNKLGSSFQASQAYVDAMDYTNKMLEQLSSGRTTYTDQIKDLMEQIKNREKFSYDMEKDTLFQNYLQNSIQTGRAAMQDTMGQAAALTGGYGSSYATSAANQAYNAYIQDAYNNVPEYYQLALDAYNQQGQELMQQYEMAVNADAAEYDRLANAYSANFQNAQTLYGNEYNAWADEMKNAYNLAGMANSDYWNTTEFAEKQRQFNANLAEEQRQFNSEMAYKNASLAQSKSQHDAEMAYKKYVAEMESSSKSSGKSGSGTSSEESNLKDPTETQLSKALKAYNEEGEEGLLRYYDSIQNVDPEKVWNYVHEYGTLPETMRDYTKTGDYYPGQPIVGAMSNIGLGAMKFIQPLIDTLANGNIPMFSGKDTVVDQYGNEYKIKDLPEEIQKKLKELRKGNTSYYYDYE